ncbi:MAG TPA: MgtC/SapB family protein [Rubrivivax sp.]|jgi:putative Mg2+ transporter-C (MgtC) family protein|nr:MgtC/SapB family protein [Rubrivivax sp.]
MWQQVTQTLSEEFSGVSDTAQITRVLLRLLTAALLGGVLGYEREHHGKAAGLRTHMLVAMGAALFVLVPQQAGMEIEDMSRVIQGVVAGIGFLCAGAIIKNRAEEDVHGLTTAASVWLTAAIGIACGLGREVIAVLSTLLALAVLALLPALVSTGRGKSRASDDKPERNRSPRQTGKP